MLRSSAGTLGPLLAPLAASFSDQIDRRLVRNPPGLAAPEAVFECTVRLPTSSPRPALAELIANGSMLRVHLTGGGGPLGGAGPFGPLGMPSYVFPIKDRAVFRRLLGSLRPLF